MSSVNQSTDSSGWTEMLDRVGQIVNSLDGNQIQQKHREQVLLALGAYTAKREDFKQFVHFSQLGYTKNLVIEIGQARANVIVMCWAPKQASAFHGHEGSQCFVKVLAGELLEERVAHPKCCADTTSGRKHRAQIMRTNEVTYIDDSIGCHRVTNKSTSEPAVTLHVYTPPYRKCRLFEFEPVDAAELTGAIDLASGRPPICMERSRTIDVTFNNAPENQL